MINFKDDVHKVQDSSKIQDYIKCERMYFFRYVMNLRPEGINHNLKFGEAFHRSKDIMFTDGYSRATAEKAYQAFLDCYREEFDENTDLDFKGKNPQNVELAIIEYMTQYKEDDFKCLHTEVGISVPIADNRVIYGKMDSILHGPRGYFSLETKTAGSNWSYMGDQYMMRFQFDAYTHFLYSYFPPEEVWCVVADVTIFKKQNEHLRIPCVKSWDRLESWLYEANRHFGRLEFDFEQLQECKESDIYMKAFLRRVESCVQYNRICPYFDLCHAWNNPLQHQDEIPMGFVVERWDPREQRTHVKFGVEDGKMQEVKE